MKTKFLTAWFASAVVAVSAAFAVDKNEVTLTGEGQCAKCSLNLTESCQGALVVKKDGKDQVYLIVPNAVSEKFDEVCAATKTVKVTGVVSEQEGKKVITASKIEPVKT